MTAVHAVPPDPDNPPVYPFAQWLDGRVWHLVRGRDFWGPPWLFARRVRASANARRIKVELDFKPDGQWLSVRGYPDGQA